MKKTTQMIVCFCVWMMVLQPIGASTISGRGSYVPNDDTGIGDVALYEFLKRETGQKEIYTNDLMAVEELTITDYDFPIASLQGLRKLYMPNLKIMNLAIGSLVNLNEVILFTTLEELHLYNYQGSIPAGIDQLLNLKSLRIEGGLVNALPQSVFDIITLKSLVLKNIPIAKIHPDIAKLMYLEELVLSGLPLQEVPLGIYGLSSLTTLELTNLGMEALSEKIEQLDQLKTLRLDRNKFSAIPSKIYELDQLQYFSINQNHLTSVNRQIQALTWLAELDLSDNLLITLPMEIVNLTNLNRLNLANNKWSCLPSEFKYLSLIDTNNIFDAYNIKVCGSGEVTTAVSVNQPIISYRDGSLVSNGYSKSDIIIESNQPVYFIINEDSSVELNAAMTFSMEGRYVVLASNEKGELSNSLTFVIDKTNPIIKITDNANELGIYQFDVAIDANEDGYFVVNGVRQSLSGRILLLSDYKTYQVSFVDYAGNVSNELEFIIQQKENNDQSPSNDNNQLWMILMFLVSAGILGTGTIVFLRKGIKEEE